MDQITSAQGCRSIQQFCENNSISRSFFYKLRQRGLAPSTVKLGSKTLVTPEAEAAWRRKLAAMTE